MWFDHKCGEFIREAATPSVFDSINGHMCEMLVQSTLCAKKMKRDQVSTHTIVNADHRYTDTHMLTALNRGYDRSLSLYVCLQLMQLCKSY